MEKLKTIYVDSALSIIKGALCVILQIPTSRTTESVKKKVIIMIPRNMYIYIYIY